MIPDNLNWIGFILGLIGSLIGIGTFIFTLAKNWDRIPWKRIGTATFSVSRIALVLLAISVLVFGGILLIQRSHAKSPLAFLGSNVSPTTSRATQTPTVTITITLTPTSTLPPTATATSIPTSPPVLTPTPTDTPQSTPCNCKQTVFVTPTSFGFNSSNCSSPASTGDDVGCNVTIGETADSQAPLTWTITQTYFNVGGCGLDYISGQTLSPGTTYTDLIGISCTPRCGISIQFSVQGPQNTAITTYTSC